MDIDLKNGKLSKSQAKAMKQDLETRIGQVVAHSMNEPVRTDEEKAIRKYIHEIFA